MIIRLAKIEEAKEIANIHMDELATGFLSSLGLSFLSLFYKSIILSPFGFAIVAIDNDRVIGFISGTMDIKKFYKFFIKKYFVSFFSILAVKLFKPSVFKGFLELLFYPEKIKSPDIPASELLTIAVLSDYHGKGIAQNLLCEFANEMEKRGVNCFKVVVGESLKRAIKFYENAGFKFQEIISPHKDKPSRLYLYKI